MGTGVCWARLASRICRSLPARRTCVLWVPRLPGSLGRVAVAVARRTDTRASTRKRISEPGAVVPGTRRWVALITAYLFRGSFVRQPLLYAGSALQHRRAGLTPGGVVPRNRPQSVVLCLESHGRFLGSSLHRVEAHLDLMVCLHPMPKMGNDAVPRILGNRSSSIQTQADVQRRPWRCVVLGTRCIGSGKSRMGGWRCADRPRCQQYPGSENKADESVIMLEGHLSFIIKYGRHSCNTGGYADQEVKNAV